MAYFWKNSDSFHVTIVFTVHEENNQPIHQMEVRVGKFYWSLSKNYVDFETLHSQLQEYGVPRDLFPSQKPDNAPQAFVADSKTNLNKYLQSVVKILDGQMPKPFQDFLEMKEHDCFFIVEDLYERYLQEFEESMPKARFHMSVLELHALCRVFKEPFPDIEKKDMLDYASIVDVLNNLANIYLNGSDTMNFRAPIKTNDLEIDFCFFKALEKLEMKLVEFHNIGSLGSIRNTMNSLKVEKAVLPTIGELLLNDANDKTVTNATQMWPNVEHLTLNSCQITEIDISINLVPNLLELRLADNKITSIPDMRFMKNLAIFDVTNNQIEDWDDLHLKLSNVRMLHAGKNQITLLRGFRLLNNLEYLNLASNSITDFDEIVEYLVPLNDKLSTLIMRDNPVQTVENFDEKFYQFYKREVDVSVKKKDKQMKKKSLGKASKTSKTTKPSKAGESPRTRMSPRYYSDDEEDDD